MDFSDFRAKGWGLVRPRTVLEEGLSQLHNLNQLSSFLVLYTGFKESTTLMKLSHKSPLHFSLSDIAAPKLPYQEASSLSP